MCWKEELSHSLYDARSAALQLLKPKQPVKVVEWITGPPPQVYPFFVENEFLTLLKTSHSVLRPRSGCKQLSPFTPSLHLLAEQERLDLVPISLDGNRPALSVFTLKSIEQNEWKNPHRSPF